MGFPITADIVGGGRHRTFPAYMWFVDQADGPVWQEMDQSFDEWDRRTGQQVAFFVDPFQRDDWALDFLRGIVPHDLVPTVLGARKEAQRFFRERLAEQACEEL